MSITLDPGELQRAVADLHRALAVPERMWMEVPRTFRETIAKLATMTPFYGSVTHENCDGPRRATARIKRVRLDGAHLRNASLTVDLVHDGRETSTEETIHVPLQKLVSLVFHQRCAP
ncbi:MAG: hypothetical protein ABIG71_00820 [Candidatus Uhrbacteria bacterium]